jgi:hypothetical protein
MADTLTSELKVSLAWLFQDVLNLSTVSDKSLLDYRQTLADGTGTDHADKVWHDQRTLAGGTNEDLALSALPVTLFANALNISLAKVKAILLVNTATTVGENLVIGGATSHEWLGPFAASGNKLIVPADSCLLLVNKRTGWNVTSGSADKLRIANSGAGSITYQIAVLGTSA